MSDIVKVREWQDTDGREKDEWGRYGFPEPPTYIESQITGDLRASILARLGRDPDDAARIHIIEGEIEGGWSEFTVEMDYDIEVWIDDKGQSQRVFTADHYSRDTTLAEFLAWASPEATP